MIKIALTPCFLVKRIYTKTTTDARTISTRGTGESGAQAGSVVWALRSSKLFIEN
jgi:hypothetical protein